MKLNVKEIFYSLQGEGARAGEGSIFIRLTKCNLSCSFCDTDFQNGRDMSIPEILEDIKSYPCKWIIWTGGEPTIQLTDKHLVHFKNSGYNQAIETNGTRKIPSLIDYIACSPKRDYHKIKKINPVVDEVRLPVKAGDILPALNDLPIARKYFVSPVFAGDNMDKQNIDYCVELVKNNPVWALSLQIHKLINIE